MSRALPAKGNVANRFAAITGETVRRAVAVRWALSFAAAILIWLVVSFAYGSHSLDFSVLTANLGLAVPYVLVGLGEMVVIAAGNGNIDLSVPYVMTLAAYLGSARQGSGGLVVALALAGGIGVLAGLLNSGLVLLIKIPPIVATLGTGYILESAIQVYSQNAPTSPNQYLVNFVTQKIDGVYVMVIVFAVLSLAFAYVLQQSQLGRSLLSFGQSPRAARYSGVSGNRAVAIAYVVSAVLSGVAGIMLGAYTGGATPDMADAFQLAAIAVVVLGGTPITGGSVTVAGVWGGSLFLLLLATLLNDSRLGGGWQQVVEGCVIIGVITLFAGSRRAES